MDLVYEYSKPRRHFGKELKFDDMPAEVLAQVISSSDGDVSLLRKESLHVTLDTAPQLSVSKVTTKPVAMGEKGQTHNEGGWPQEIDIDDEAALVRYRKRREKGGKTKGSTEAAEPLGSSVSKLGPVIQMGVKQNNTINIYETYFDELLEDHSSEPPSAKGLAVLRDPCSMRRTAATIDWIPDGPTRIAVSYSVLQFQDPRLLQKNLPVSSYIWDVQKPNAPESTFFFNIFPKYMLTPDSPLCALRFNPKNTEVLVGGSYNGLICTFDRRSSESATSTSQIETSHHDPVYDVQWPQSKTGTSCVSCSTDGQILWWDTRRLNEPVERITLEGTDKVYEAGPHKYLVGTEQGIVASINKRSKKTKNGVSIYSDGPGKHHAPIYSIQRNPVHTKYFMTYFSKIHVGDWTARIWTEDLKTPIMTTKYHQSYLTAGCWSPTRPGVFFVARQDGVVDVWDYFFRQNEVAYSHKVCDDALSSIAISNSQNNKASVQLVAIGDNSGTVSLLELSDSLWKPQGNEKPAMGAMLEREFMREKNLLTLARDAQKREKRAAMEAKKAAADLGGPGGVLIEEELMNIERNFINLVKDP